MSSIPGDYLERVYAGFLGKNVGIRLGAPVEPAIWTYERIRDVYGDVTSYLKPFRNFAADDDANGPAYFIRPLLGLPELPGLPGKRLPRRSPQSRRAMWRRLGWITPGKAWACSGGGAMAKAPNIQPILI